MAMTTRRMNARARRASAEFEARTYSTETVDCGPRRNLDPGDRCRILNTEDDGPTYIPGSYKFLKAYLSDGALLFFGGRKDHEQFAAFASDRVGVIHRSKPERPAR